MISALHKNHLPTQFLSRLGMPILHFTFYIFYFSFSFSGAAFAQTGTVSSNQKIADNTGGFSLVDITLADNDQFGFSTAAIGDLDNDGVEDLAVGARNDDTNGTDRGAVYVLLMNSDGTIKSNQKIADNTGGFSVTLADSVQFGTSVAGLGDLDGDGVEDLAVGANLDDTGGADRGAVYVLFMNSNGTVKSNQKIADNTGGFNVTLTDGDHFGRSVASLGDLDNDGVEDIAVGADGDDTGGGDRGSVYVLFMNSNGTVKSNQKIADNTGGFSVTLTDSSGFGNSVAAVGDLDNDGVEDIAVGARKDDTGGTDRGAVYVLLMNTNGTVKSNQKIADNTGGFNVTLTDGDRFGASAEGMGDLDGDGVEDLAVGANQDNTGGTSRGAVYVLFMNSNGTVKSNQKIADNTGGFNVTLTNGDRFGVSIADVGDLDNDGVKDLVVGANADDSGGTGRGAVYVLFMNTDGTVDHPQKISDTTGEFSDSDLFGVSTAAIGDLDNDGVEDLAVGAFGDDTGGVGRGAVYVLFMNTDGTVSSNQKIADNTGGFNVTLTDSDAFGIKVAGLGDLDNDGVEDLAVGAIFDDTGGTDRGAVYVLFMNTDGTVSSNQKIADNTGGFSVTLVNSDQFGVSVAGLGDLDNDGVEDLAVAASKDDTGGTDRGAIYVLLMNSNGTVKSNQKIADNTGGFSVTLTNSDFFGEGIARMGDLDNDGVEDLAVGAQSDDTGGTDRGAVYVLLMNTDGTVKSNQKIADNTGGFNVTLTDIDNFGISVADVGDLDNDGVEDLAVGAYVDDTGGTNRGAVYVLFLNQADFAEAGNVAGVDDSGIGSGIAWGDYDGDGDPDLYVVNGAANKLYRNDGSGSFTDVSAAPVNDGSDARGAGWGDVDSDGDLDLYLANTSGATNQLFRNDGGGSFTDITVSPLDDVGYGTQVALADYDNDGDLDIYVVNQSTTAVPNRLFKNDGSGTFTEVGGTAGVDDSGDGRGGAWGDYDGDGDPDLYVANNGGANKLYSNDGDGTFTDASAAPVNDANNGVGTAWGDYDNDGDLDLYLTNFTSVANKLFQNNGSGTFTEVGAAAGVDDSGSGQGASWGDYDNDGDLDLYLAQGGPNRLFQNNGNGTFNEVGVSGGVADSETGTGASWADYDGDGDLDLYVTNFNSKPNLLYKNNGNSNRWLHVKLTGVANNKSAIGTLVTAVTGSTRQKRYVDGGSGFLSQPSLPVEFGFGSTTTVDSLIVKWPDGFQKYLTNVATNQVLSLTETNPTITSISPTSGNVGTSVTITGTEFDPTPANNTVFFDPIQATVTAASTTSLTVTVPSGAGFGPISVTVNNRTAISDDFFLPTFSGTSPTISAATLAAKVDFSTEINPRFAAMGDVDGDAKPDLVVSNNGSDKVSVFRNTSTIGTVSFAGKIDFATATDPVDVAIGDLDGDGKPDIAVTNEGSNSVSVFHNTSTSGTVSFAAKVDFATGTLPQFVALGDLDGDGKSDIAVSSFTSNEVSVLRNTTTPGTITAASFAASVGFGTGTGPSGIAIGDLEGDGKPDIAVS